MRAVASLALTAALIATVVGMLAGCEHDPRPKQRPQGVPLFATWAGGFDGGAYYNCSAGGTANECTVWDDGTGNIKLSGRFQLRDQHRSAYSNELVYKSSDSSSISLDNGLVLKLIK